MDYICNYLGNKAWALRLPWSGHDAFNAEGDHEWMVGGSKAGLARTVDGFTFLQVLDLQRRMSELTNHGRFIMQDTWSHSIRCLIHRLVFYL